MILKKYISKVTKEFKDIRVVKKAENLLKKNHSGLSAKK